MYKTYIYLELLFFSLTFGLIFSKIGWDKLKIILDFLIEMWYNYLEEVR